MAFDAIETPFGKSDKIIGGSASYVAYAASNFVKPIQQISIVGNDFPQQEFADLRALGIQLEGVEVVKDKNSFFWSGRYHLGYEYPRHAGNRSECIGRFQSRDSAKATRARVFDAGQPDAAAADKRDSAIDETTETDRDGHHEFLDGYLPWMICWK